MHQFRKVDGVWQRKTRGDRVWRTLHVERVEVGRREKFRQRNGTIIYSPVIETVWSWT